MTIEVSISTEQGTQTVALNPKDADKLAAALMDGYERMYDGRGSLINPQDVTAAQNLRNLGESLQNALRQS